MKKFFALIALATVSIVACQKEIVSPAPVDDVTETTETAGTYTFTLTASGPEITKTSYADEKTFSWDANDEISVLFHNGETHEFKTLKTTSGGNPAVFSGTIPDGWTVGASETEKVNAQYWALFPAGAHVWDTEKHRPQFNIPAVTDFTAADHFSVNIPMQARGDNTTFSFKHAACAYKISFKNVDASTVRLKVTHSATHALSGTYSMENSGSNPGLWATYAGAGSVGQSVSFIKAVAGDKTVEFYFSIPRYGETSGFQPTITLTDEDTGFLLYSGTAKSDWTADPNLEPRYDRMVVLPQIPASGAGTFVSKFGIGWFTDGTIATTAGDGVNYTTIRATSDDSFFYVLLGIKKSMLTINPSYYRANSVNYYFGVKSGYFGYLYRYGAPQLDDAGSSVPDSNVIEAKDVVYYEWKCTRNPEKFGGALASAGTVGIKFCVFYNMYVPTSGSATVEDWSHYVYSPEVSVTFDNAYVAP